MVTIYEPKVALAHLVSLMGVTMTSPSLRRPAMPTDLIVCSLICLFAPDLVRRVSEVFAAKSQPVDSTTKA